MAGTSERTEPPDRRSNEKYKCCQKTNVKTIICVICGAAYHVGHIKYINRVRRIDDSLTICEDHADLDLTSKVDHMFQSIEFRTIIAQIKLEAKKSLRQELLVEVHEKTQESLNKTILDDNNDSMENLKMKSTLLKNFNSSS